MSACTIRERQGHRRPADKVKERYEDATIARVQVPLRLAWALTVHKSQGMTLKKAVVDVQGAFASGHGRIVLACQGVRA